MMSILFIVSSAVVAGLLYFTGMLLLQCWNLKSFSGPTAIPILGNCYSSEALYFMRFIATCRKKYGRFFTFFAFTKPYLVVCDPVVVRRVLSDSKTFFKGSDYSYHFNSVFGQGLVTSNGERHKKDRSTFGKYFVRSNINPSAKLINEVTKITMDEVLTSSTKGPKVHNIEEFFAILALRVFMNFSLSTDLRHNPKREKELCHVVSKGSWAVGRLISLNAPMWKIFPWVKLVFDVRDELSKEFGAIVDDRKAALKKGEATDIDDCLAVMLREEMDEKVMFDHFVTLICAGHDTTAFFSSYMCYLLAQHPAAQEKLYEEIRHVLKGRTEVTPDDIAELKYLPKVMQETLRLYAVIPNLTRYAGEEVHVKEANVTIPKGCNIMIPLFLINRDPELWENPGDFIPERFDGAGNDFTSAKSGFFPFGYGTRVCIGNILAQIESAIFLCQLLLKYKLTPDPGFKPFIFAGISLTTSNGINIQLEER